MKKDIDWDAYYNGYSPYEKEDVPEDSILHINYGLNLCRIYEIFKIAKIYIENFI